MAWQIALIENTININEDVATELFAAQEAGEISQWPWESVEDVMWGTKLDFNSDHMEHMDFLWDDKVQEILKRHKIEGVAKFGDLAGDQFGQFWGYYFDGKGDMLELKGELVWD